jgi:hypothetical protein
MRFSTSQFWWTPKSGLFSQDLSSLCRDPRVSIFHQLYNDSCDAGITLISDKTGKEADFFVNEVDMHDGEVQGWYLLPTPETIRKLPRLNNTRVLIIND